MSSGIIWKQGYRLPMREWHLLNADINLKQKSSEEQNIPIHHLNSCPRSTSHKQLLCCPARNWTGEGSCLWKQLFSSTLSPKQLPFFETKTEPERGSKLKKKAPRHKIGGWKAQYKGRLQIASWENACLHLRLEKNRQGWLNILE